MDHLPPKEAFNSTLKGTSISDEDYLYLQEIWRTKSFKTLRDHLEWYNNLDVVPFLSAVNRMMDFWENRGISMFKDGISLSGLALKDMFKRLPKHTFFVLENEEYRDLYYTVKENIVGGPSILFHRYHEVGKTVIGDKDFGYYVKAIVGFDANGLYCSCLMESLQTGIPFVWRENVKGTFSRKSMYDKCNSEIQYLEWESWQRNITVEHRFNAGRQAMVDGLFVDGIHHESKTIFQFNGCISHGCECQQKFFDKPGFQGPTPEERRNNTEENTRGLSASGYTVVRMRECNWRDIRYQKPNQYFLKQHFIIERAERISMEEMLLRMEENKIFGLVECDISTPDSLKKYLAGFQPIFKNTMVSRDGIGPFMKEFAEQQGIMNRPRRAPISTFSAKKIMLTTEQVKWYIGQKLEITTIYQMVQYKPKKCFVELGEEAADARRSADADPENLSALGESMKLLGNSYFGKHIQNQKSNRNVKVVFEEDGAHQVNGNSYLDPKIDQIAPGIVECSTKKKVVQLN